MEVFREVVHAAENFLWGSGETSMENGEEPVSGIQGKGTSADPYDAGNAPKGVAVEHAIDDPVRDGKAQQEENKGLISGGLVPGSGSSTAPAGGQVQAAGLQKLKTIVPKKESTLQATVSETRMQSTSSQPGASSGSPSTPAGSLGTPVLQVGTTSPPPPPSGGNGSGTTSMGAASLPQGPPAPGDVSRGSKNGTSYHMHSTGYAAEGGDFDAKEPGAGKEADRLMAEHNQQDTRRKGYAAVEGSPGNDESSSKKNTSHHFPLKNKMHIWKHRS
ncbi:hypothetical protein ACO22_05497 [Paracoccidioides brasiliensis]|uniref:Uncharacterized protein n=1 Tax=Paracoccidioides brasiliensis TaxID=121759 RepID=A0A1D2JA96_PARBR|nr:hypothetical protein ACO22_05497 [Paracoccidioides brasiliensis]